MATLNTDLITPERAQAGVLHSADLAEQKTVSEVVGAVDKADVNELGLAALEPRVTANEGFNTAQAAINTNVEGRLVDIESFDKSITEGSKYFNDLGLNISKLLSINLMPSWDDAQFKSAIQSGTCAVSFVGTSVTVGNVQLEEQNAWVSRFRFYLQNKYPSVNFTFNNMAIGGRRLEDYVNPSFVGLESEPTDQRSGYFVARNAQSWPEGSQIGQSWQEAVEATSPDLLVISHGINDRDTAYDFVQNMQSAVASARAWVNTPSVIIATDIAPYDAINSDILRQIQDANSAARWSAIKLNCGLLDIGRAYHAVKYNEDTFLSTAYRQSSILNWVQSGSSGVLTENSLSTTENSRSEITLSDKKYAGARFVFDWTPNDSAANFGVYASLPQSLNPSEGGIIILRTGSLFAIYGRSGGGPILRTFTVDGPVVSGEVERYEIRIKRNIIEVWQNEIFLGRYVHGETIGYGGLYMGVKNSSFTNVVCDLEEQQPISVEPLLTESQLLGDLTGAEGWNIGNFSTGGNSINHPSRLASKVIYDPVIREFISQL